MKVHFKQGDSVKAGDTLFTIDPRQLEAQLEQATAIEMKDQAQVRQAQANVAKDQAWSSKQKRRWRARQLSTGPASKEATRYGALVDAGVVSHGNSISKRQLSRRASPRLLPMRRCSPA